MTAREAIGDAAASMQRRLDQVLDSEDAVIVMVDRHGATSYFQGFGASGCQLELMALQLESALRTVAPGCALEAVVAQDSTCPQ